MCERTCGTCGTGTIGKASDVNNQTTAKERVQQELAELNQKIVNLVRTLYGEKLITLKLSPLMTQLLEYQLNCMREYAAILQRRLSIWDEQEEAEVFKHAVI